VGKIVPDKIKTQNQNDSSHLCFWYIMGT